MINVIKFTDTKNLLLVPQAVSTINGTHDHPQAMSTTYGTHKKKIF